MGRDRHRPVGSGVPHRRAPLPLDPGRHRQPRRQARRGAAVHRSAEAQATPESFGWPQLVADHRRRNCQPQAIDDIVEQGEGARGDWSDGALRPLPRRARRAAGDQGAPTRRSSRLIRSSAAGVRPVDGVRPGRRHHRPGHRRRVRPVQRQLRPRSCRSSCASSPTSARTASELGMLAAHRGDADVRRDQAARAAARHAAGRSGASRA